MSKIQIESTLISYLKKLRSSYEDYNSIGLGMINFDISCRRRQLSWVNEEFEGNLIHEYHENGG